MSKAVRGLGSLQLGDGASPENYTAVAELLTLKRSGHSMKTADVTNMDSPTDAQGNVNEEFIGTIVSGGTWDFTYNWIPDASGGQTQLRAAFDGHTHNFRVVSKKMNTAVSPATPFTYSFAALVETVDDVDFDFNKQVVGSAKLKVSGGDNLA